MQINLSLEKEELTKLIELIYLGSWMVNAHRTDEIDKYASLEQKIYEIASKAGLSNYILYDKDLNAYFQHWIWKKTIA